VQSYPNPEGKWQISTEGGFDAKWSPDGKEIYYRDGSKVMATAVTTEPTFSVGKTRMVFTGPYSNRRHSYDISPDGKNFFVIKLSEDITEITELVVILNWVEELKRLVPTEND
jgi:hypothetical protein